MATSDTVYSFPTMATNTKLLQSKSLAKTYYETRKMETTYRAQPPGTQNNNTVKKLQKCLNQVGDEWRTYYEASLTFIIRGTFTEEEERERLLNQLALEYGTHRDWLNLVQQGLKCMTEVDKVYEVVSNKECQAGFKKECHPPRLTHSDYHCVTLWRKARIALNRQCGKVDEQIWSRVPQEQCSGGQTLQHRVHSQP